MKKLLIPIILFMSACSGDPSIAFKRDPSTLTHKAYYYYGLSETKDRKLIKEITGVDPVQTEWCAAFVNMVLLEQGLPTSASVSDYPLTARSFLFWGDKVKEPKQGDIVVFKRGNSGWQGHVAFYVSSIQIDGKDYYYVLGGNQSDSVSIEPYPVNKVLGIRRLSTNNDSKIASIY